MRPQLSFGVYVFRLTGLKIRNLAFNNWKPRFDAQDLESFSLIQWYRTKVIVLGYPMAVIKSGLNLTARNKRKLLDNSIHLMNAIFMMIDIKVWILGFQGYKATPLPTIYLIQ